MISDILFIFIKISIPVAILLSIMKLFETIYY